MRFREMADASIAGFEVLEKRRDGHRVRVFKDNYTWLGELFTCFDTFAARECLVCDDVRLTYTECRSKAGRLARYLREVHDVSPGDRIGLALPNSPEWIVSFVAIAAIGAVPALINPRAGRDEFAHCLESTDCRLRIDERMDDLPSLLDAQGDEALPLAPRAPGDEALLMFTSGTTGLPKAASLSHESVLTALKTIQYSSALIAKQMAEAYGMDLEALLAMRPPPVNLLVFPLFHVSGCQAVFLTGLTQGGKLVLMPRWSAKTALELIEREKVTGFPAVPTMYRDLLGSESRGDYDLSSLGNMSVGGQATPPALLAEIHGAFPGVVLGSGYGMTEAGGTVTLAVGREFIDNPRSAGRPVSTIDVEIRDDKGHALPSNQHGEVHIRGAALMTGYVGQPPPFDAGGWFATGDLGCLDEDGLLYIVDRKTDMVISGGENIYCAEVERVLGQHEAVVMCAAFGVPDERLGEKLVACVVLHEGARTDASELLARCAQHLAKHKVPKAIGVQFDPLPQNATGKIIKQQVAELWKSGKSTP